MNPYPVEKIVSGGQTGVDRAALDVAIYLELPHGGWCPAGRRAEDGRIPEHYQLRETKSKDYSVRTEQNVVDSDGTLILFIDRLSGGSKLTLNFARRHRRPVKCIDLGAEYEKVERSIMATSNWLRESRIHVLNVAGPRASNYPDIGRQAESYLVRLLKQEFDE